MKKLKFFLFALAISGAVFTSCSDDDAEAAPAASIEGKWFYSKTGLSGMGIEQLSNYTGHETGCSKDFIEILAGGVFKDHNLTNGCNDEVFTSTWTKTDEGYTIGTGTSAERYVILSVDDNTLKVGEPQTTEAGTAYFVTLFTRN